MSRLPLHTPRERLWRAIRACTGSFDRASIIKVCEPPVSSMAAATYLYALCCAGYIKSIGNTKPVTYVLAAKGAKTPVAPCLDKKGQVNNKGLRCQAMWQTMKVLASVNCVALAGAASMGALRISPAMAKTYLLQLKAASYLTQLSHAKNGKPAEFRLVRNTGPLAPTVALRKCLLDRNTGHMAELQTAQEVCDGIAD